MNACLPAGWLSFVYTCTCNEATSVVPLFGLYTLLPAAYGILALGEAVGVLKIAGVLAGCLATFLLGTAIVRARQAPPRTESRVA